MSTTIRRRPTTARRAAAAQGTARKVRRAKATTGSVVDRVMETVPLNEHQLGRVFLVLFLVVAVVLAVFAAIAAGVPQLAAGRVATIAADAGFEVRRVDVRGVKNMNELMVYQRVLGERHRAMTELDLNAVRDELLGLPWVKDARVSRQLPDSLVIDIVERVPHAVLRKPGGRLMLIDETGRELEPVAADKVGTRLVVSGPGSGQRVEALGHLLDAAPALRPQIREAEWIGNRRWNLTFRTNQVLALPEGDDAAPAALVRFAKLDGTSRLLGGRITAIDMRAPDRLYLRIPGLAAEEAAEDKVRKAAAARNQETP